MEKNAYQKLFEVPFTNVKIEDKFWAPKLKKHRETTLKVCLDKCEETGRISNFAKAGGTMKGEFEGIFFNDSDVYKVLEGIAYSLMNHPDPELEKKADEIIDLIASAQQQDGYLMTYFTLVEPDKRWTDMSKHEMYCGGHLIEAAVAYKQATGKEKLLNVARRLADHYDSMFGPDKRHWVPGHEEIELALVKLYRETGQEKYLKLAYWLLEERGHGYGKGEIWDKPDWGPKYCQDDKPIREMTDVSGHAVRAMYLYTGVADVAALIGEKEYVKALDRLWESVALRNMYITGGIGPSKYNEGFTHDYDLPNDTAYCETCASVGMVYWNHRMNMLHGDSKYADVVERAMYNGALAGVSLNGDRFFYVNPLESDGNHHRQEWYDCSCCPTQIARFIPSIGNYVYCTSEEGIWINLYIASKSTVKFNNNTVNLTQITDYPWDGKIDIIVEPEKESKFEINMRFPGWCKHAKISVNGATVENLIINAGYIKLMKKWRRGDLITIDLDMPVERVYSNSKVKANTGKVALQRGPLVYCVEEVDNKDWSKVYVSTEAKFITEHMETLLGGVTIIKIYNPGYEKPVIAVPYYAWDNREPGRMKVWLDEKRDNSDALYINVSH